MLYLKAEIVRYVDDHQPGYVSCIFKDAAGKEWEIIEKVPVVSEKELDSESNYPQPCLLACCVREGNITEPIVYVDLNWPWGLSAETGETVFQVFNHQLVQQ